MTNHARHPDGPSHGYQWCDTCDGLPVVAPVTDQRRRDLWSGLLAGAAARRHRLIIRARLTSDDLATAAAKFGIVADGEALPLNALRGATRNMLEHAYSPATRAEGQRDALRSEAARRMHEATVIWSEIVTASHQSKETRP